jgi:c-di-GMP-binding flagellar brake protein YcgR
MAASVAAPAMTVRAMIARRRSVPANLTSLINPGLGVRILEAPREFGLLIGAEQLDAPVQNATARENAEPSTSSSSGVQQEKSAHHAAEAKSARSDESAAPASATNGAAPNRPKFQSTGMTSSHQIKPPTLKPPAPATAVLVGGDELDEIADVLVEFGVETIHREPTDPQLKILGEAKLLIASARLAIAHAIPVGGAATVSVAVCDEVSGTMRTMLRKQGFEYLIRQPVHIEALRLLIRYALFDQPDRRSRTRIPFGYEVSWRMGWRRETGDLLDISKDGCRLLAADNIPLDSRLTIKIPNEVGGGQQIKLAGTVVRSSRHRTKDDQERYAVGVAFDELSTKMRDQLVRFCELWADTLPVVLNEGPQASRSSEAGAAKQAPASSDSSTASVVEAPVVDTPDDGVTTTAKETKVEQADHEEGVAEDPRDEEPSGIERRQQPRSQFNQEIVEVDSDQRVVQALLGRDISMGGMRIDPQFGLSNGDKLQIALFDTSRGQPLILHAVVARDDGGAGMALRFADLTPEDEELLGNIVAALPAVEALGMSRDSPLVPTGILSEEEDNPTD